MRGVSFPALPTYTRQLPSPDKIGKRLESRSKLLIGTRFVKTVLLRVLGFGGWMYIRCGAGYDGSELREAVRTYGGRTHFQKVRSIGFCEATGEEVCELAA